MSRPSAVRRILAGLPTSAEARTALPQQLVEACVEELAVDSVGMVLMAGSRPAGVIAASDELAKAVEDLQFTLGEGPCVESAERLRPVLVPDLAAAGPSRWPAFAEGALRLGVGAAFALPLSVGSIHLGVLDIYATRPRSLTPDELATALDYGDAATAVLLHLQEHARPQADGIATVGVLDDRAQVHQASGVVSVQAGVDLTQAMLLLRARAYADGVPVLEVARAVLAHEVRFGPAPPGRDDERGA